MNSATDVLNNYIKIGKQKTSLSVLKMLALGFMAGVFISLAAVGSTVAGVTVDSASVSKLIGACIFPAGLTMVVIAGSELFTGNCLLVIPLFQKEVKAIAVLKNWFFVYLGNLLGAVTVAVVCTYSNTFSLFNGETAKTVVSVAQAKINMPFGNAFLKGVLCNFLVCIAVWMSFFSKTAAGKTVSVFFPVMLFVLCGYEHSVANMYYIPAGILAAKEYGIAANNLTVLNFLVKNLIPVTLGNIAGGGFVGLIYWFVYGKNGKK